tara:strand:- start:273 stop:857 length:585 start_codon:yes stop_codon:yes gene_type:complete
MANKDAPFGFRAVGEVGSGVNNGGTNRYAITDNFAAAIYQNSHVMLASGVLAVGTDSGATNLGVFNGCFYQDPNTQKPTWSNYYPASTNITQGAIDAYVYDDPKRLFEAQCDGTIALTDIGKNIDSAVTAGSTVNGQSKTELKASSVNTTAALQFKITGISKDPDNSDASSANANWLVFFNEHLYFSSTGITGV